MTVPQIELPTYVHDLKLYAIQVAFKVNGRPRLVDFPADRAKVVRGAFNSAMAELYCQKSNPKGHFCENCNCIYGDLSGKPAPEDHELAGRFQNLPSSIFFWLPPEAGQLRAGGEIRFNLTLVGSAVQYLPLLIPALSFMAKYTLGQNPDDYVLDRIGAMDHNALPSVMLYESGRPVIPLPLPPPISISQFPSPAGQVSSLSLRFSPMVILYEKDEAVFHPTMPFLMKRLLGRMALLAAANGGGAYSYDSTEAETLAKGIKVQSHLTLPGIWAKRDSGGSLKPEMPKRRRHLPGMSGSLQLKGEGLEQLLPLLRLGQWVHMGKMTLFGMGRYTLSVAKSFYEEE